ncbi:hypothetical protein [Variovorax sp. YR566]|uniref:hypothetical protein n=1 Tax=Variovorax sp. YR566 TaxID=3450237 RepID=UPI003F7E544C
MSYYTRLELQWDDADYASGSLTPQLIAEAAESFVVGNGWSLDVLKDLRASAEGKGLDRPGYNSIYAEPLIAMLREVSLAFPSVKFFARGVGEEMFDTWARDIRAGEVHREFGPFEPAE